MVIDTLFNSNTGTEDLIRHPEISIQKMSQYTQASLHSSFTFCIVVPSIVSSYQLANLLLNQLIQTSEYWLFYEQLCSEKAGI